MTNGPLDELEQMMLPAFPTMYDPRGVTRNGMTLRDWFAGQAVVGLIAGGEWSHVEGAANGAYRIADAMLAERAKREGKG